MPETWRNCGSCKRPIPYAARYWVCSVSTCNRARFQLVFCSMDCWDAHVPVMNHRDAWAESKIAPRNAAEAGQGQPTPLPAPASDAPRRVLVRGPEAEKEPDEVLVIASRLKAFIKEKSDFNTSADALEALSTIIRRESEEAIRRARAAGRRTVMGRDFEEG